MTTEIKREDYLKVASVSEPKEDKRGRKFITLRFTTTGVLGTGQTIFSNQSPKTRNVWEDFKDEAENLFKGDNLYYEVLAGNVKVGSLVAGNIVQFNTTPYTLGDKQVTSYTTIIFENEDALLVANNDLKNNLACVVDPTSGTLTAQENLKENIVTTNN